MTWWDGVPDKYQEHLPGPPPGLKETLKGVGQRGLEEGTKSFLDTLKEGKEKTFKVGKFVGKLTNPIFRPEDPSPELVELEGIEPFLEVGQGVKESLKRVYAVAAQPLEGEAVKPRPFGEAPFEFMGALAGYIAALPVKVMGDLVEKGGRLRKEAAQMLLGGGRGEGGEWTPEQVNMSMLATELTLGAMVGGGPGAGTGVANIGRKAALKMLAKEFRAMRKTPKAWVKAKAEGKPILHHNIKAVTKFGEKAEATLKTMTKNYPIVTKGLRQIPQEALDVVKEIGLAPKHRTDIHGRFRPSMGRVEYQITQPLSKETIPHEVFHAVQLNELRATGVKRINPAVLEAHAYEFEGMYLDAVKKLPKEQKPDMALFMRVYDEAKQSMFAKYGTNLSAYKMEEVVGKAHLARKGELQSLAKSPKTIGTKLKDYTRKGEAKMPKLSQEDRVLRDITKASMGRFLREQGLIRR